jgi:hypothetical protein
MGGERGGGVRCEGGRAPHPPLLEGKVEQKKIRGRAFSKRLRGLEVL